MEKVKDVRVRCKPPEPKPPPRILDVRSGLLIGIRLIDPISFKINE